MSTVTTANCACCGPQSGSGSGSGSGGGGSGSGNDGPDIPCGTCFGAGTPHPTDAAPVTVDVTFLDLGTTFGGVNDSNWDYQFPTGPPGVSTMYVGLCTVVTPGEPNQPILVLFPSGGGPLETVYLAIENCRPFVATGTSSLGPVVVTGNY